MRELRLAAAASRRFSRPPVLAALLRCLGEPLARRCREHLAAGGKLWEQPRAQLLVKLESVLALSAAFEVSEPNQPLSTKHRASLGPG